MNLFSMRVWDVAAGKWHGPVCNQEFRHSTSLSLSVSRVWAGGGRPRSLRATRKVTMKWKQQRLVLLNSLVGMAALCLSISADLSILQRSRFQVYLPACRTDYYESWRGADVDQSECLHGPLMDDEANRGTGGPEGKVSADCLSDPILCASQGLETASSPDGVGGLSQTHTIPAKDFPARGPDVWPSSVCGPRTEGSDACPSPEGCGGTFLEGRGGGVSGSGGWGVGCPPQGTVGRCTPTTPVHFTISRSAHCQADRQA